MNTSLCYLRPDNYNREVLSAQKPVLILCMPFNEAFPSQLKVVEAVADRFRYQLKVGLLEEAFIDTFKKNLQITGTPTFLYMEKGMEKSRMIGLADQQSLVAFIAAAGNSAATSAVEDSSGR